MDITKNYCCQNNGPCLTIGPCHNMQVFKASCWYTSLIVFKLLYLISISDKISKLTGGKTPKQ